MKNLFVGNLNFQTTETDLRALFEPLGQIGRVHMPVDRETGRVRGFAFIEMANDEEAKNAISALNGKEVSGRRINVSEARPKERSGPPNRDNRGGNNRGRERRDAGWSDDYSGAPRQPREPRW